MISNGKKALVHVAKAKLGLGDAEYLDILAAHGKGAQSSRDLDQQGFEAVMAHFERLGFAPRKKFFRPPQSKARLMSKVAAIRADLNLTEGYVDGMTRRMFKGRDGLPIASHRWLDADQLHKLVAALTYYQRRKRAKGETR